MGFLINKPTTVSVGTGLFILSTVPLFFICTFSPFQETLPSYRRKSNSLSKGSLGNYRRKLLDTKSSRYDWLWSIRAADYKIFYKHKVSSDRWIGSNIEDKEGLKKACIDLNGKTNKGVNDLLNLDYWCYENEYYLD